jgi:hypothetical protein
METTRVARKMPAKNFAGKISGQKVALGVLALHQPVEYADGGVENLAIHFAV